LNRVLVVRDHRVDERDERVGLVRDDDHRVLHRAIHGVEAIVEDLRL